MTAPREVIDLDSYDDSGSLSISHTSVKSQILGNKTTSPLMNDDMLLEGFYPNLTVTDQDDRGHHIPDPRPPAPSFEHCCVEVVEVFPDVCHQHVRRLYDKHLGQSTLDQNQHRLAQVLIEEILDHGGYPKERDRLKALNDLKRKRDDVGSDDDEAARWKTDVDKRRPVQYHAFARAALLEAFPLIPAKFVGEKLVEHGNYYGAYMAIVEAERALVPGKRTPYTQLKARRAPSGVLPKDWLRPMQDGDDSYDSLGQEIEAAHERRRKEDYKRDEKAKKAAQGEAEDQSQREMGEVIECRCCFDEIPISKVTHCNGDILHFFCFDCARRNADNDIGTNKYQLQCMDASICEATFCKTERARFLDDRTMLKLESIEQEAVLRLAEVGFEDFVSCPFCHYGHICPPLAIDKEFRCRLSDCGEISCRLCKERSHVPLSCEEHKRENGISERRVIEEARTEALIRTCPKCKVRILKEDGCNKVVCTICYTVICDYCGKDISKIKYSHFDGQGTGVPGAEPGPGKCPLYDQSSTRKDEQIEAAGKDAMEKVRKENPGLSEDDLKIKFSKEVETQNKVGHQHPYHPHPLLHPHPHLPRYPYAFVPGPIWPVPAQAVPDVDGAMQHLRRDQELDALQERIRLHQVRRDDEVRQAQLDLQHQVELVRQRTNDTRDQVQRDIQLQVEQMRERQNDARNQTQRGFRQQLEHLQKRSDDARHERQRLDQEFELLRERQNGGRPEAQHLPFGLGALPEMGALQYRGYDRPWQQIRQQQEDPYDPGNFHPHTLANVDNYLQHRQENLPRAENLAIRQEEAGRMRERRTDQARRRLLEQYQPPRAN